MRVETQNSTFHGMSLHESGVKDAEGERGRKKEKMTQEITTTSKSENPE